MKKGMIQNLVTRGGTVRLIRCRLCGKDFPAKPYLVDEIEICLPCFMACEVAS